MSKTDDAREPRTESSLTPPRVYSVVLGKNSHLLNFFRFIQSEHDLFTKPLTNRDEFAVMVDWVLANGKKIYFNTENLSLAEAWSLVEQNLQVNWSDARGLTNWEFAYVVTAHSGHPSVSWWHGTTPLSWEEVLAYRTR